MDEFVFKSVGDIQSNLSEFTQTTYTDIQHDFHELNHEIQKDSPLESFRHEYAKLFGILQKSMTNQARYIEKCRILESEIVGNKAKAKTVTKLSEEDALALSVLNGERDRKYAVLCENRESLRVALEENQKITDLLRDYEFKLEELVTMERSKKDYLKQLKNRKEELKIQYDNLSSQIPQYEEINRQMQVKLDEKDRDIENSYSELKKIEEMIQAKKQEEQKERLILMNLERERDASRDRLTDAKLKLKDKKSEVNHKQEELKTLNKRLLDLKRRYDSAQAEKQDIAYRCEELQKDLGRVNSVISSIEEKISSKKEELKKKQAETDKAKSDFDSKEAERTDIENKKVEYQHHFADLRKESDGVRHAINDANDEIDSIRRNVDFIRRQIDSANREENSKIKKNAAEKSKITKSEHITQMYMNQMINIDAEIAVVKNHIQDQQKKIFGIEKEREKYSKDLSNTTNAYLHSQDIIKDIMEKLSSKSKEIVEADKKVKQQQSLYEHVRNEREIASKKVKEVRVEIEHLDLEFIRVRNQINQYKDQIRHLDFEKIRDKSNLDRIMEEGKTLKDKLAEVQVRITTSQRAIASHTGEISKLERAIKDAEVQLGIEGRKLQDVKKERDQMSNQNAQRELEIKDIGQKLETLRNQCKQGEKEYSTKVQDISKLRAQLESDQIKLNELSQIDTVMKDKRDEINDLESELYHLKAERKAMEDELKVPINIHRWTLLESNDPNRFEKLKRYQELQLELVERTKQVNDLKEKIKVEEDRYQELNANLKKRVGMEIRRQNMETAGLVKSEKFSLELITEQLDKYRNIVKEYKKELNDAETQLLQERNKWIKQKKRDIKRKQKLQEMEPILQELGLVANDLFVNLENNE